MKKRGSGAEDFLGPPVEKLESGYPLLFPRFFLFPPFFLSSVVYFSRGTLPQKRNGTRHLGDLAAEYL